MINSYTIGRALLNAPLIIFLFVSAGVPALELAFLFKFVKNRRAGRKFSRVARAFWIAANLLFILEAGCFVWARFVEPRILTVTYQQYPTPKIKDPKLRVRIVHLTDLHVEGESPLLDKIAAKTNALKPDFIVLTGDYWMREEGRAPLLKFLKKLKAKRAVYAVYGNWEEKHDPGMEFALAGIDLLDNGRREHIIGGVKFVISGYRGMEQIKYFKKPETAKSVNIVLYHFPDRIVYAEGSNVDYYFCGHTHGGQVRMPFYGAFFTLSRLGKQYEMGRYKVGRAEMFVSRGIGMEGPALLKMRFLCPPEIAVHDISGEAL